MLNVCSMFGLVGMPKLAAYCTRKFAMVGFSEALRNEFGREGLGVTALCPGFVDTNLFTSAPLGEKQKEHKIPPRIFCTTPEKVAHAAVKAIRRNKRMVVMTPAAWLFVSAKRFVPGVMDFLFHLGRRKRVWQENSAQRSSVTAICVSCRNRLRTRMSVAPTRFDS